MGINKLIVILASLSFTVSAFAQEMSGEKKPFSIYGDFAGSLSFYDSENTSGGVQNPNNNHDDFNIDLVEINLEKNWSKSKLHLSIGYGFTANGAAGVNNIALSPLASTVNLMNAYYHMNTSYGLGFTFGKFESPVGHESYNHMDNSQYTRSYGFMLAPFFNTGAQISYAMDMWSAGLIFSNGSGRSVDGRDNNKTMALVVDVDPMENLHVDLNYVTGTEGDSTSTPTALATHQVNILDVSAAFMVNEMFDVALNYIDHGQKASAAGSTENKATSIAAYANANFGMFGLGLRYEMLDYDSGVLLYNGLNTAAALAAPAGTDNSLSSITVAAKAEIDQNALVMLEYRMDSADDNGTFTDSDGTTATDSFNTITASLMYRF